MRAGHGGATCVLPHGSRDVLAQLRLKEERRPAPLRPHAEGAEDDKPDQCPRSRPCRGEHDGAGERTPVHPGELDVAAMPERAHAEGDEDDRREEEELREHAHPPCRCTLGDGRAEAEEALARHHDQQ